MAAEGMAILGGQTPRLTFGGRPSTPGEAPGRRVLSLDEEPAYELSFWCGTCPFLFERLEGARQTLSLDELQARLNEGLDGVEQDVLQPFGALLPHGRYLPMLLEVTPRLVQPG